MRRSTTDAVRRGPKIVIVTASPSAPAIIITTPTAWIERPFTVACTAKRENCTNCDEEYRDTDTHEKLLARREICPIRATGYPPLHIRNLAPE